MAGKIFEPRDPYTNEVVLKEAEEVMGCTCYSFIGVRIEVSFQISNRDTYSYLRKSLDMEGTIDFDCCSLGRT